MSGVHPVSLNPKYFFGFGTSKCRRRCQSYYAGVIVITKMAVYKEIVGWKRRLSIFATGPLPVYPACFSE
jgi:hypothetical protein